MIHEFDPVIYQRKLWITYDATADELNEAFPSGDINGKMFEDEEGYFGITYQTKKGDTQKGGVLIRFADNKEAMTSYNMVHEAIHAAGYICRYVGIEVDLDNDEAFTYLATWIVKCCESIKEKEDRV